MKNQVCALILAIGMALCGYFIYCGIDNIANRDRYVTVKGLAEREVMADKAKWTLSVNVSGNNLEQLYPLLEPKVQAIIDYLKKNGVTDDEIVREAPSTEDRSTWYEWEKKMGYMDRYVLTSNLVIVSMNVDNILNIYANQLDLLKLGAKSLYINYEYTGLNDLKPEMVEEATRNARTVADKFAKDANCSLGSIRTARQGQFEVTADDVLLYKRKVRVVTTIDYYLK